MATQNKQLLRALWLAAKANGGTLRIGPSTVQKYPGDKHVWISTSTDEQFGDLIIIAHENQTPQISR